MSGSGIFDERLISDLLDRIKHASDGGVVSLHELEVPATFGRLPHCFRLDASIDGHKFSAWGTARERDEAAAKCIAELLERICLRHSYPIIYRRAASLIPRAYTLADLQRRYPASRNWLGSTSSGVALHSKRSAAVMAGAAELVERHTVLKALAFKIPPLEQDAPSVVREFAIPAEIGLRFLLWRGALGLFVCVLQIRVRDGAYYSFGTGASPELAAEKAFFEGAGMIGFVPDEPVTADAVIRAGDLDSFQRYHRYSNDRSTLEFLGQTTKVLREVDAENSWKDFYYSECAVPKFLEDIRPLVCVRVVSPLLQPLFFDLWKSEYLNPAAGFVEDYALPKAPHIIS